MARPLSASLYTPPSSWNVEIRLNSYSSCFYMLEVFPSQFYPKEFFCDGMILTYVDWYLLLEMDDITQLFWFMPMGHFVFWEKDLCQRHFYLPLALSTNKMMPSNGWASLMLWILTVKPTSCADEVGDCISTWQQNEKRDTLPALKLSTNGTVLSDYFFRNSSFFSFGFFSKWSDDVLEGKCWLPAWQLHPSLYCDVGSMLGRLDCLVFYWCNHFVTCCSSMAQE